LAALGRKRRRTGGGAIAVADWLPLDDFNSRNVIVADHALE
jgi:hypothetical protein